MRSSRSAIAVAFAVAVVAAIAALAPVVARAANIVVTTPVDVVDPTDGVISLREAFVIASSNLESDTITLAPATEYDLTSCSVGELRHTQVHALTIDGNGASIYQTCFDRRVINNQGAGSDLTLNDVALTGGFNSGVTIDGAGLKTLADLTITGSQIAFLNAGPGGTAIRASSGPETRTVSISDTEIYSNVASALKLSFGALTVSGSTIINNTHGGLYLVDALPLTISDSEISGNDGVGVSTTGQGDGAATLTNVTIEDNDDSGFRCSGCGAVVITGSTISGNGASPGSFGGGGVIVKYDQDGPTDVRSTTITDTEIVGNRATTHRGGGVQIGIVESSEPTAPSPQLVVQGGSVVNDNATTGSFDGGGIAVETGDLTVTDSTVDGNLAGPAGGLTASKGGGIYVKEAGALPATPDLTVTSSSIDGNEANSQGGGIWIVSGGTVAVTDSTLDGNDGGSLSGGGLYTAGAAVTVTHTSVAGNAAGTGGGLALGSFSGFPVGSLSVVDSTISGNSASFAASGGGGIFVNVGGAGATATVRNSTVSGNTSANFGGGIMVMQTSRLVLDHATVVRNTGPNGANVFVAATSLTVGRSALAEPTGGDNCALGGATTSLGFSFADDASCGLGAEDLESGASPQLGPLALNGGPTRTHLPGASSPLGGLVPAASCVLAADQRGVARPQGLGCEAGAVEITELPGGGNGNLVANPGFEFDPERFFLPRGPGVLTWTTDAARSPTHSLKIVSPRLLAVSQWTSRGAGLVPVRAGRMYEVSAYVRTQGVVLGTAGLAVTFLDAVVDGSLVGAAVAPQPVRGTRDWTRVAVRVRAPRGAAFLQLRLTLVGRGTAWFDDLEVRLLR